MKKENNRHIPKKAVAYLATGGAHRDTGDSR